MKNRPRALSVQVEQCIEGNSMTIQQTKTQKDISNNHYLKTSLKNYILSENKIKLELSKTPFLLNSYENYRKKKAPESNDPKEDSKQTENAIISSIQQYLNTDRKVNSKKQQFKKLYTRNYITEKTKRRIRSVMENRQQQLAPQPYIQLKQNIESKLKNPEMKQRLLQKVLIMDYHNQTKISQTKNRFIKDIRYHNNKCISKNKRIVITEQQSKTRSKYSSLIKYLVEFQGITEKIYQIKQGQSLLRKYFFRCSIDIQTQNHQAYSTIGLQGFNKCMQFFAKQKLFKKKTKKKKQNILTFLQFIQCIRRVATFIYKNNSYNQFLKHSVIKRKNQIFHYLDKIAYQFKQVFYNFALRENLALTFIQFFRILGSTRNGLKFQEVFHIFWKMGIFPFWITKGQIKYFYYYLLQKDQGISYQTFARLLNIVTLVLVQKQRKIDFREYKPTNTQVQKYIQQFWFSNNQIKANMEKYIHYLKQRKKS